MRRSPLEEGRRWLEQAQAKALLYGRGADVVLGHSVERLAAEAAEQEPELGRRARRWSILDGFYVPTRYPSSLPDSIPARVYTAEAARDAVALAAEIVQFVADRLAAVPAADGR